MVSGRTFVLECGASQASWGAFAAAGEAVRLEQFSRQLLANPHGGPGEWLPQVRPALAALRRRVAWRRPVVLVIPAHLVLLKWIRIPRVEPAQREKLIRFEAPQHIPYALEEVVWDSVVAGEHGGEMDVLLAAAKRETLEPLGAAVADAGFKVAMVLPAPLAMLAAVRAARVSAGPCRLVLDPGPFSTTLLQIEGTRFAVRVFSPADAALPPEARSTRLAQEVARSVLHFRWRSRFSAPQEVCLRAAEGWPGLSDELTQRLRIPIRALDQGSGLEIGAGAARQGAEAADAELFGAALTQLRAEQAVVDLRPESWRRSAHQRRRRPWLAVAAMLAAAAPLPPALHFQQLAREASRKTAGLEREIAPWRARDQAMQSDLRRLEETRRRVAHLQGVLARHRRWLGLLAQLQAQVVAAEDVWLDRLELLPGPTLKLHLSGRMLDRAAPSGPAGPATFGRVKTLLAGLTEPLGVAVVENERFDNRQPGVLQFDFVLVPDPRRPL